MDQATIELKEQLSYFGLDYYKRQTGRTLRMMEAAKAAAGSGKSVTVLMKDERSAKDWISRGWQVAGVEIIHMKVREDRIDWKTLKMLDHRANNTLFIDHDALYVQFSDVLGKFSEFDSPVFDIPHDGSVVANLTPHNYETLLNKGLDAWIGTSDNRAEVRELIRQTLFVAFMNKRNSAQVKTVAVEQKPVTKEISHALIKNIVEQTLDVVFADKALPRLAAVVEITNKVILRCQKSVNVGSEEAPIEPAPTFEDYEKKIFHLVNSLATGVILPVKLTVIQGQIKRLLHGMVALSEKTKGVSS